MSKPKIKIRYATEFGSSSVIIELNKLLSYTKRFKIYYIDWEEND